MPVYDPAITSTHAGMARLSLCRHRSPEWTVLSQVNCVVHIEVAGFQILLNGFHHAGEALMSLWEVDDK